MSEEILDGPCEYAISASSDIIKEVKDAIDKHEETVVKQEEAVKKIEDNKSEDK